MDNHNNNNQQQHRPQNSVHCCKCGSVFTALENQNVFDEVIKNNWRRRENLFLCVNCQRPRHINNVPYVNNDDRCPPSERGVFMEQKNEDGSISIWRLVIGPPPSWVLHRIEPSWM